MHGVGSRLTSGHTERLGVLNSLPVVLLTVRTLHHFHRRAFFFQVAGRLGVISQDAAGTLESCTLVPNRSLLIPVTFVKDNDVSVTHPRPRCTHVSRSGPGPRPVPCTCVRERRVLKAAR